MNICPVSHFGPHTGRLGHTGKQHLKFYTNYAKLDANTEARSVRIERQTNTYTGTQQEEEEVVAKEVGDEWALSKQHLEQEVPIGRFAWRKEVCLVCEWTPEHVRRRCGCNTTGPADFETTTQRSRIVFYTPGIDIQKLHMSFAGVRRNSWFLCAPLTSPRLWKIPTTLLIKDLNCSHFQNAYPYAGLFNGPPLWKAQLYRGQGHR